MQDGLLLPFFTFPRLPLTLCSPPRLVIAIPPPPPSHPSLPFRSAFFFSAVYSSFLFRSYFFPSSTVSLFSLAPPRLSGATRRRTTQHRRNAQKSVEEQGRTPLPPRGFVYHETRCGSTLVANMLASLPPSRVFSESKPPTQVCTLCSLLGFGSRGRRAGTEETLRRVGSCLEKEEMTPPPWETAAPTRAPRFCCAALHCWAFTASLSRAALCSTMLEGVFLLISLSFSCLDACIPISGDPRVHRRRLRSRNADQGLPRHSGADGQEENGRAARAPVLQVSELQASTCVVACLLPHSKWLAGQFTTRYR